MWKGLVPGRWKRSEVVLVSGASVCGGVWVVGAVAGLRC